MKTPSIKLFKLIKKMSPSEKRYFKRFGLLQQKNNSNKYTLLFDAINNQSEYNEEALLKQFKNYDFVNNFSEIKKYLFNQIQKALRNFHAQSSVDIILYGFLSDIGILYNKELYDECHKIIKKAKKIATKHEKWNILLLLNEWKGNLMKVSHQVGGIEDYLKEEVALDKKYLNCLENEQQYFNKSLERSLHLRKFGPDIELHSNLDTPQKAPLTFKAKRYLFSEIGLVGYAEYDADKVYEASKNEVDLFEKNPHFIEAMPKQYFIALINMQDACKEYKYNLEFDAYMDKAIKVLDKYPFDNEFKIKETLIIHILKCSIYTQRNNTNSLKETREQLKHKLQYTKQQGFLEDDVACYAYFYLMRSAITLEDYEEALENYNDFLNLNLGNYRSDIQIETKVMGLIPHFELGNYILLDSLTRSASRTIQRKHGHLTLGKILVDVIRKSIPNKQGENTEELLIKELKKLKVKAFDQLPKKRLDYYFVFLGWIRSKIYDKSVLECIHINLSKEE